MIIGCLPSVHFSAVQLSFAADLQNLNYAYFSNKSCYETESHLKDIAKIWTIYLEESFFQTGKKWTETCRPDQFRTENLRHGRRDTYRCANAPVDGMNRYILNNILNLVSRSWRLIASFSYWGKYKNLYLSRFHIKESKTNFRMKYYQFFTKQEVPTVWLTDLAAQLFCTSEMDKEMYLRTCTLL